jgi:hypothetical protein
MALLHLMQEEGLAREDDTSKMQLDQKATPAKYVGHRNYDHLSSRSPDDIEEVVRRASCCYANPLPCISKLVKSNGF